MARSKKDSTEEIVPVDSEITNENEVNNQEIQTVSEEKETVFIYCGPSNNLLARYTTYKNGYPLHLKDHFEELPVLKSLFVEPEKFTEFERNVVQSGTVENIYFEKAKEYFSKAVR